MTRASVLLRKIPVTTSEMRASYTAMLGSSPAPTASRAVARLRTASSASARRRWAPGSGAAIRSEHAGSGDRSAILPLRVCDLIGDLPSDVLDPGTVAVDGASEVDIDCGPAAHASHLARSQHMLILPCVVGGQRSTRREDAALVVPVVASPECRSVVRAAVTLVDVVDAPVDLRLPVAERAWMPLTAGWVGLWDAVGAA